MEEQDELIDVETAACVLNTPKHWVDNLLDSRILPFIKKGETKLLSLKTVLQYKKQRDALRREALVELTRLSQELDEDESVDGESST